MAKAPPNKNKQPPAEESVPEESPTKRAKVAAQEAKCAGDPSKGSSTPAACGAADTSQGSSTSRDIHLDRETADMLGVPTKAPPSCTVPTKNEILSGEAMSPFRFIAQKNANIKWRFSKFLSEEPVVQLRQPLDTLQTPPFNVSKASGQPGAPTGYKEPFDLKNCAESLSSNGIYEASMTVWQFDLAQNTFENIPLGADAVSWAQYDACLDMWNPMKLVASAQEPNQMRFMYEGFIPSAVSSISDVKNLETTKTFFQCLPACGGHAQLFSLLGAIDNALTKYEAGDKDMRDLLIRLFQVSLNVTCRKHKST